MPRVKRGTVRRANRKKLAKLTKGYFLGKSKLYRFMKEAADKAGRYAYRDRRRRKRDFRRLWILRRPVRHRLPASRRQAETKPPGISAGDRPGGRSQGGPDPSAVIAGTGVQKRLSLTSRDDD
jgi:hypothetical protein